MEPGLGKGQCFRSVHVLPIPRKYVQGTHTPEGSELSDAIGQGVLALG